jgi:hypothetical protein
MIPVADMKSIARERLQDARALLSKERYDGAVYICGYAVEIALKARICRTLGWTGFPETNSEWADKKSLRTHDLAILRAFAGVEKVIIAK